MNSQKSAEPRSNTEGGPGLPDRGYEPIHSTSYLGGCSLNIAYRVCMPMSNLPSALFAPEEYRSPQSVGRDLLPSAKLGLCSLHLHNAGKLRTHILLYDFEAGLTFSATRCDILTSLSNHIPSMGYPATGVSEGYVLSMGVQLPHRLGSPSGR